MVMTEEEVEAQEMKSTRRLREERESHWSAAELQPRGEERRGYDGNKQQRKKGREGEGGGAREGR